MHIFHFTNKGCYMDMNETVTDNQMNDKHTTSPNKIFEVPIKNK
jgi:hypothetical protein